VVMPLERVIYKYTTLDVAKKIIEGASLLFSTPLSFNDPFDLYTGLIDTSFNEETLKNWFESAASHFPIEKRIAIFDKYKNNTQYISEILEGTLQSFKTKTGITCFSKSYTKSLMWSHYADKHAGVCLGLNIVPIGLTNFTLLEVNYIDSVQPLNYFKNKPNVLMYWLYTKSKIWSYEEEVRAVYLDKNGLVPFERECLKEVHFGMRTTADQREEVIALLQQHGYAVQRFSVMSMDKRTFDLKVNTINQPFYSSIDNR
jgi:hypothetical protein